MKKKSILDEELIFIERKKSFLYDHGNCTLGEFIQKVLELVEPAKPEEETKKEEKI